MEIDRPFVSVIVPTYNVERYCKKCFDSLLCQTLVKIEIILVDDGSTDSSGSICDEYAAKDPRVKVIHQTNKGLGLSRNSGLEIAIGEYVGFVDSDDYVSPEMYKVLYDNACRFSADISYCSFIRFSNDIYIEQKPKKDNRISYWDGEAEIKQYMLDRVGMPPESKDDCRFGATVCCGIFLRERIEELNARFVSERQFIAEDMIFDIDVIPYCKRIVHTDAELYYYRYNPNSLTATYKPDRFERNVELHHEMSVRLSKIYSYDEYYNSLSRYLIKNARIAVMQEEHFLLQNGFRKARRNANRISSNRELQKALREYKWDKLPIKYAIMCLLQKHKFSTLQLLICRINNI